MIRTTYLRVVAFVGACAIFLTAGGYGVGFGQQTPPGAAPADGRQGGAAAPQGRGGGGGGGRGARPLDEGPWEYQAGQVRYRVTVVTRNVVNPWGIAFLPDGDLLVTERNSAPPGRPGQLRVIRKGVLDPTPIGPLPDMLAEGLGGMMDVSLHPQFAQNRLIYFTYSKRHPDPTQCLPEAERQALREKMQNSPCSATTAVARARWDGGSTLTDVKDILVTKGWYGGPAAPNPACGRGGGAGDDNARIARGCSVGPATGSYGSRLAWDKAGLLYVTTGDRNNPQFSQDPQNHNGKILRIRDDGSIPPDNPFVGRAGALPRQRR